ncbi:MAG: ATP-dependent dethiobiotin synthetase BioD [Bacteroidaceae bacterium]|nr:ATP-dependent dethiobiotin synthetase BioD [Bacteroidaceae bacterium]
MKRKKTFFISGIDTNIGKSYATGYIASQYMSKGYKTITQKFIQTGNVGFSEDIQLHRKIMGIKLLPEDYVLLTSPIVLPYPASPHLAANMQKTTIHCESIANATRALERKFDVVLIEGAGGLMVPISENFLTIDYIQQQKYPVILVTSGRLGSINHTLLSLEALKNRDITLNSIVYNTYPKADKYIENETARYLKEYLKIHFPNATFDIIPEINIDQNKTD